MSKPKEGQQSTVSNFKGRKEYLAFRGKNDQ